jgi:hypothetical protein
MGEKFTARVAWKERTHRGRGCSGVEWNQLHECSSARAAVQRTAMPALDDPAAQPEPADSEDNGDAAEDDPGNAESLVSGIDD